MTFTKLCIHAGTYSDFVQSGETIRVLRDGKSIADIAPVMADLLSWKRRKSQSLVIGGESVSRLILEERGLEAYCAPTFPVNVLIFFDSTAFAKRYVAEEVTDAVIKWCDRAAEIALPELL